MRHKIIRLYDFIEQDKAFKEFKEESESLGSNKEELHNIVKIIMLIIQYELTDRQMYCFCKYVIDGKKMKEISQELKICIPTVSRHIKMAKRKILKYLRYSKAVDKYVSSKTFDD